jgi:hypothetical protein
VDWIHGLPRGDTAETIESGPDFGTTSAHSDQYGMNEHSHDTAEGRVKFVYATSVSMFDAAMAVRIAAIRASKTLSGSSVFDHSINPRRIMQLRRRARAAWL